MVSRYSKAFTPLKTALLHAPTLSLPTGSEFNVFVIERKGMALGDLTQPRGPHQQTIAYLSRELDVVSRGWSHCLRVIAVTALLTPEALKIINGQNLTVLTPHGLSGILNTKVQSDNGSIFKAAVTQGMSKALGTEYHTVP